MRYEVHGFAGLGYPFTRGGIWALDKLIDELPDKAESTPHPHGAWDEVADGIVARSKAFGEKPVVCLFGHSWGCLTMLYLARRLQSNGIGVEYLAAIDPTALVTGSPPMLVPTNVRHVDEFWSTKGFLNFPKWARRDPSGKAGGKYVYPKDMSHEIFEVPAGHIATASHKITVERIIDRIARIIE